MSELWAVGRTCFCSSHDDFIGVFDSEEQAKVYVDTENKKYQEAFWGNPYYYYKVDTKEFEGCRCEDQPFWDEWYVVYQVPSLGKFQVFPGDGTCIETYKLNKPNPISEYWELEQENKKLKERIKELENARELS